MATHENEMLAAALTGESTALQQLLLENCARLEESIRPRIPMALRSVVDVEDVLQETFVRVFRDLASFREGNAEAFFAWVRAIADARLTDAIRAATRQKRGGGWNRAAVADVSGSFLDLVDLLSDEKRSPSRSVAAQEAINALQLAMVNLPEDQHEAIWLRHIEGLSLAEVVERMGRPDGAVRGLLHRGKAALKVALGDSAAWFSRVD